MNYGFGGRLKREFPSQVVIDITEVCNLSCRHCPHPDFKKSEHYGARYLPADLNKKAVDEIAEHGTQYLRYCAEGETLIHPECYDFLDYAVRNSKTFVTLTTNGTILNEKRVRKLLDSGLHMVDVSLDAFAPDTYAKIRVGGDLEVTRANVLNLIKWAQETKTKIVVSYIEQPENRHETEAFKEFWQGKVHQVVIRRLHSAANAIKWVGLAQANRRPCVYPWERMVLAPSGMLKFCPQDWFRGAEVADYRTTTIKETWHSEFYSRLRNAHMTNQCFGVCKGCPDWQQTMWPGQGLAYSDLVKGAS